MLPGELQSIGSQRVRHNRVTKQQNCHNYTSVKCKLKSQWDITLHLSEWLLLKRQQIINVDMMRRRDPHALLVGMQISRVTMENTMEFPQNLKVELLYDPANPLLHIYLKKMKTLIRKDTCTPTFTATLFTLLKRFNSVQFSHSVMSGSLRPYGLQLARLPVHLQLSKLVHQVSDAIQPSHPLFTPYSPAFNLSQHQGLFQWVGFLHQVATVLEPQLQYQSFQWIFRTDIL